MSSAAAWSQTDPCNSTRCSWDFCPRSEQCSKKWHPAKTLSELINLQDRMLSCLEIEIKVITNYTWRWAQGRVEGIWCLPRIMYQTQKCSRPGGFTMGDIAVHSEPSGWELSTVNNKNRYFVDVYQLVLFQRQRKKKKKNHINTTVTGNYIYWKSCQFHVSIWLLKAFDCLQLAMLKIICILKHIHTHIYASRLQLTAFWKLPKSRQDRSLFKLL